jgi:predicted ATPase
MSDKLPLEAARIRNFKAIRDSGRIDFTPLTVFVGNNGSGKSSVIEGLEFFRRMIVSSDLEDACRTWIDFRHIWNQASDHKVVTGADGATNPMVFEIRGRTRGTGYTARSEISESSSRGVPVFIREELSLHRRFFRNRDERGLAKERPSKNKGPDKIIQPVQPHQSLLSLDNHLDIDSWVFLDLSPTLIGAPGRRSPGRVPKRLSKTGRNLAEFLLDFYETDPNAFRDLLDTLRLVVPYARELTPRVVEDAIEKRILIEMREASSGKEFDLRGWVLSTGTLRVLALLACLRHPTKAPPVLFVEEIENGLDPRTVGLLVEEIRSAVESGSTQVIATTHSPYLLDKLSLSQLVLVERDPDGSPRFTRPSDDKEVLAWSKEFAPGKLYSMGTLSKRAESDDK